MADKRGMTGCHQSRDYLRQPQAARRGHFCQAEKRTVTGTTGQGWIFPDLAHGRGGSRMIPAQETFDIRIAPGLSQLPQSGLP